MRIVDSGARWRVIGWYGLLAGTVLRFVALGLWPLWCDELASLQRAMLPLSDHLKLLSKRPPLFELMLREWARPEITDVMLRIPSAIFGVATLWLVWRLSKLLSGDKTAAIAAWLFALSPLHLMFSRIARSYSMAAMLAAVSMFAVWNIYATRRRRWWFVYVAATALALYTDSLMCAVVLAQNVFMFVVLRRERRTLATWIVAEAVVLALFAPWLVMSLAGAASFAMAVPYTAHQLGAAAKAAYLAFAMCVGETVSPLNLWVVAPAFAGFFAAFALGIRRLATRERTVALFLAPPLVLVFATGMFFAATSPKHLSVMLPMLTIVLAVGVACARPLWLGGLMAAAIFGTTFYSISNYFEGKEFADASMATPWRDIADIIQRDEKSGAKLFIGPRTAGERFGSDEALFKRYYRGKATQAYLPRPEWRETLTAALIERAQVWLLLHRDDPRDEIERWLSQQGRTVTTTPIQSDEETLRRLKVERRAERREGGAAARFRSHLYTLFLIEAPST